MYVYPNSMSMDDDKKYFNFKIFNPGPTIYIAVLMVYSCHSTSIILEFSSYSFDHFLWVLM